MSRNRENRLKKQVERNALSILESNSTFGNIQRCIEQISMVDANDVSPITAKRLERITSLLERAMLQAEKIEDKF